MLPEFDADPLGTKAESSPQSITAADAVEWRERKVRGGAGPGLHLSGRTEEPAEWLRSAFQWCPAQLTVNRRPLGFNSITDGTGFPEKIILKQ